MRTAILEMLNEHFPDEYFSQCLHPDNIRWNASADIKQLLCDSMATAMYRCLDHMPLEKQGLAKTRLAEYGFSKEEIEKSICKLENE